MDALVFASFVPHKKDMKIIEEMFTIFLKYYSDAEFFIGINGSPCQEYLNYLEDLKIKITLTYAITPPNLEITSDVSAYQTALNLLHNSNKEYKYVWFGHTKAITSGAHWAREDFLNNFFSQRENITNLLDTCDAGTYSLYLNKWVGAPEFKDVLSPYYNFNKPYFYTYLYLYTFYVIKGYYLHQFLNNCNKKFYTTNLISNGADIYMFERDFPQIAWRQGGYPLYKEWKPLVYGGTYPETCYAPDIKNHLNL